MTEDKSVRSQKNSVVTAKNSAAIGAVGAILIAVISKHGPDEWKSELVMAVPFISVWVVGFFQYIHSYIKWFTVAYSPDEATTVKIRRQTEKYKKKLLKELNCKTTSDENKEKIRKLLDEVQIADIETYDIK